MGGITSTFNLTTGNGLGGAGSVASPLALAAPSANSVGSIIYGVITVSSGGTYNAGNTFSAGSGTNQVRAFTQTLGGSSYSTSNTLSGTWMYLGCNFTWPGATQDMGAAFCRVS